MRDCKKGIPASYFPHPDPFDKLICACGTGAGRTGFSRKEKGPIPVHVLPKALASALVHFGCGHTPGTFVTSQFTSAALTSRGFSCAIQ